MKISNKAYDVLKWIAQKGLPAIGFIYFMLTRYWGLPYGEEVLGTILTIDTALGYMLGLSTNLYKKDLPKIK